MAWPAMSDYQEALQHPGTSFSDSELRRGTPILNQLGLPKPISGNFASVYQVACGGVKYAARCFLHPDRNHLREARYAKIDQYLEDVGLPYMVAFEYLARGIRVRGDWYPILKMEWLEGDTLSAFIEMHRTDPGVMCDLSRQFLELTIDLGRCGIAHGDLQHGNILVVDEKMRLIDYDGMYVPGLDGLPSNEIGHRNYQHPQRTPSDFGPTLDNFSAWVIFLSLMALSADPSLWEMVKAGDECLLFRQEDFKNPQSSTAFRALARVNDDELRQLFDSFQTRLVSDGKSIPALDETLAELIRPRAASSVVHAGWVADHASRGAATGVPGGLAPSGATTAAWVLDHMERPSLVRFSHSLSEDRIALSILYGAFVLLPLLAYGVWGPEARLAAGLGGALGLPLLLLVSVGLYRLLPEVKKKRQVASVVRELVKNQRKLEARLDRLSRRRSKLGREEREALSAVSHEKAALDRSEVEALSTALDNFRKRFLERELSYVRLTERYVPGVGPKLADRLRSAGYRTAKDISWRVRNVHGIGEKRTSALMAWRRGLESEIQRRTPSALPKQEERSIRSKYQTKRLVLDSRVAEIRSDYQAKQSHVDAEQASTQAQLSQSDLRLTRRRLELQAYREITFRKYLVCLILPMRCERTP